MISAVSKAMISAVSKAMISAVSKAIIYAASKATISAVSNDAFKLWAACFFVKKCKIYGMIKSR